MYVWYTKKMGGTTWNVKNVGRDLLSSGQYDTCLPVDINMIKDIV